MTIHDEPLRGRGSSPVVDRFGLLLVAVLGTVAVTMAGPPASWGTIVAVVLQAGVLVLTMRVAAAPRRSRGIVVAATAVLVVVAAGIDLSGVGWGARAVALLGAALVGAAILAVVRRLTTHVTIDGATVAGAICVYLLLGTLFTFAFGTVAAGGEAFFAGDEPVTPASLQYFSFTTLTTVGYGDLAPATRLGRSLAMTEALIGQIYLVTVVALLVGNLGRAGGTRRRAEEPLGTRPDGPAHPDAGARDARRA